jgi:hypothetical protein
VQHSLDPSSHRRKVSIQSLDEKKGIEQSKTSSIPFQTPEKQKRKKRKVKMREFRSFHLAKVKGLEKQLKIPHDELVTAIFGN